MDLRQTGCGDVQLILLAQGWNKCQALINTVMNLRIAQNAGNFLTG
jgi:hypothetical protein